MEEKQVTVIIPNYNGRQLLENCIKTLERQTVRFYLTVVDNGSTDKSTELVSDVIDINWVKLKENTGFCGAVNAGIRRVKTPYFILLNNDTEAEPDFVEELLAAIQGSDKIFSCGARMLQYKRRDLIDNAGDYYTALGWAVARGKGKPAADYDKAAEVFSCCGGAAIYRTDAVRKIGLFDERHFAYLEDVDLGYRARIFGYRNCYAPSAKVYHVGSATTGTRYNEKKVFLAARNSVYLIYKNMPSLQLAVNLPLIVPGILVKWLFFCLKGLGGDYMRGIREGIRQRGRCQRVPFCCGNLGNYIRIQFSLWGNIVRILLGGR